MERGLKERLVGAAVLAALAVIFIPMLLDDAPSGPGPITETNIPERPAGSDGFSSRIIPVEPAPSPIELPEPPPEPVAEEAIPEKAAPDKAAAAEQPAASQPTAETEPANPGPQTDTESGPAAGSGEKPAATTDNAEPSGWVIQLGSFSQEDNARELNAKLRKAGYAAYVEPVIQSGKKVYRVRVGPEVMRGEAEKLRDRIAAEFDLKGIVVRHQP